MSKATTPATQPKDFPSLLEASKGEIAKMLPEGMSVDRVARVALTAFRINKELADCTPADLGCVMKAVELGLEPGGALKHCYLIPFRDHKKGVTVCTFQVSYLGMLELARRSGEIVEVDARLVHENDVFELSYQPQPVVNHRPCLFERGDVTHVYAYALNTSGGLAVEVMSRADVEGVRQQSKSGNVWGSYWGEMARKTCLKRLLKKQRLSVELASAMEEDSPAEAEARVIVEDPTMTRSQQLGRELRPAIEPPEVVPEAEDVAEYEREPGEDG